MIQEEINSSLSKAATYWSHPVLSIPQTCGSGSERLTSGTIVLVSQQHELILWTYNKQTCRFCDTGRSDGRAQQ